MRNPGFCICENKDADQLRGNRGTSLQIVLLVLFKSNLRSGSIYTPVSRDSDVGSAVAQW